MTDRQKQDIEYYLPGDPDKSLDDGEYYYLQNKTGTERVIRVFPLDVFPMKDGTQYGLYTKKGGRLCWVDTGWGDDHCHGVYMGDLYDNREDCKNQTHMGCYWWEQLRKIQKEG